MSDMIQFLYQKRRSDFGRACNFSNTEPEVISDIPANSRLRKQFILRNPVDETTQYSVQQAEHWCNSALAEYTSTSINHTEGGWPKDINFHDDEQTKRYRRKIEKDEMYIHTVLQLAKNMENCILQNNAVNIYQQYFADMDINVLSEHSTARTVNVYQDPSPIARPINHISWSPDGGSKIAVSYCNLDFQSNVPHINPFSYIWEVENPNRPQHVFKPDTPIVCLEYNQKDPNSLVSGMFNGQVTVWDTRKGSEPVESSVMEHSHRDPVHNVLWINSKSGSEFFSATTDGQVKWWDIRKMSEPFETLLLDPNKGEEPQIENALGASCLEYEATIPARFMVGTEQGSVVCCNRKAKTPMEKVVSVFDGHVGPIYALQRNPAFVKNYLTVGDWTAKIWSEDCKESAIIWTNCHPCKLTDGAWNPIRFSVFYTTRMDGILDVWDLLHQQKQATLQVKVCDEPLRCLRAHEGGRLVSVGNQRGSTYLLEFNESLASANKNDKAMLTAIFDRENRREKILEARGRELRLKQKTRPMQSEKHDGGVGSLDRFMDKHVLAAEVEFFQIINEEFNPEQTVIEDIFTNEKNVNDKIMENGSVANGELFENGEQYLESQRSKEKLENDELSKGLKQTQVSDNDTECQTKKEKPSKKNKSVQ